MAKSVNLGNSTSHKHAPGHNAKTLPLPASATRTGGSKISPPSPAAKTGQFGGKPVSGK